METVVRNTKYGPITMQIVQKIDAEQAYIAVLDTDDRENLSSLTDLTESYVKHPNMVEKLAGMTLKRKMSQKAQVLISKRVRKYEQMMKARG